MFITGRLLTAAGLVLAISPPVARAQAPYHHHRHRAPVVGYGSPYSYGYAYYPYPVGSAAASAAIIAAATARAQTEPGLTSELAPDARQTATGGPSGGIPGFDGL